MYFLSFEGTTAVCSNTKISSSSAEEKHDSGEPQFFAQVKLPEKVHITKLELGIFLIINLIKHR